jgi:hypothetical protein
MVSKLRLHLQPWNIGSDSGFVKMYASWSLKEINLICSSCVTRSLTKWKLTSMCLMWAWKIGFADKYVAPMLSHQRICGWFWEIPNSLSRDCAHMILVVVLATILYSASVILWDTVACLRAFQAIEFGPKKYSMSPVDRRLSRLPASRYRRKRQVQ